LHPFVPIHQLKENVENIQKAVSPISPFTIKLNSFDYFKKKPFSSMYLVPETEVFDFWSVINSEQPIQMLHTLQAILQQQVTHLLTDINSSVPHF
jgi:hypothetical protein